MDGRGNYIPGSVPKGNSMLNPKNFDRTNSFEIANTFGTNTYN